MVSHLLPTNGRGHSFDGLLGLRSKAFTVDATNRRALNFYLWESRQGADSVGRRGVVSRRKPRIQ
jgi:phosphopantothenate synthetase